MCIEGLLCISQAEMSSLQQLETMSQMTVHAAWAPWENKNGTLAKLSPDTAVSACTKKKKKKSDILLHN